MGKKRKTTSRIKFFRRTCQIITALAFILIPWLNSRHISFVYGNFLSFNLAGFPLADPLAVLQITLKNAYLSLDLIIGAGVALVVALILGQVFCSWVCPFGLLSDFTQALGRRLHPARRPAAGKKLPDFPLKSGIFISGLLFFLFFSTTPVLNQLSMPAWYSRIFQFLFVQKHLSLAALFIIALLLLEAATRKRIWCKYICPQSLLLILTRQLNKKPMHVRYDTEKCLHPKSGREPCMKACNMDLDPRHLPKGFETRCTNCGDCITACSGFGKALGFSFRK